MYYTKGDSLAGEGLRAGVGINPRFIDAFHKTVAREFSMMQARPRATGRKKA
jgi:hypothetical protein